MYISGADGFLIFKSIGLVWINLAATPSALVTALGNAFLYEEMPSHISTEVNAAITGTIGTTTDKARAGLYVLLTSGYYAVKK